MQHPVQRDPHWEILVGAVVPARTDTAAAKRLDKMTGKPYCVTPEALHPRQCHGTLTDRYDPIGRCIYCGAAESLSKEHIVPSRPRRRLRPPPIQLSRLRRAHQQRDRTPFLN